MNHSQVPVARKENLVIQEMPEEVLVYDMDTNKAHCLNRTAAFVWKSCDGKNSVAPITHSSRRVKVIRRLVLTSGRDLVARCRRLLPRWLERTAA